MKMFCGGFGRRGLKVAPINCKKKKNNKKTYSKRLRKECVVGTRTLNKELTTVHCSNGNTNYESNKERGKIELVANSQIW